MAQPNPIIPNESLTLLDAETRLGAPAVRQRLLRLCAYLAGDTGSAEDLAQETLLEAWRRLQALRNPDALDDWLAGIARNICRRWIRQRQQIVPFIAPRSGVNETLETTIEASPDTSLDADLEASLEREELIELIDRALALLPAPTRQAFVERYMNERSQAEVAARLGVSENVVAVRLHRGKSALREALLTSFPEEAAAYGLSGETGWQTTRIWCLSCGVRRLLGRQPTPGGNDRFQLRCPICQDEPGVFFANTLNRHIPADLRGHASYKRTLERLMAITDDFYHPTLPTRVGVCPICHNSLTIHPGMAQNGPPLLREYPGAHARCQQCGWETTQGWVGMLLVLPDSRRFWHAEQRIHMERGHTFERDGRAAFLVSLLSMQSATRLDIIMDETSYLPLEIVRAPHDAPAATRENAHGEG